MTGGLQSGASAGGSLRSSSLLGVTQDHSMHFKGPTLLLSMAPREDFVWSADLDTTSLTDPQKQIQASVFEGKLTVNINDNTQEVDLPEDVFTDDASAKVDQHKLTIRIARRDPEGPAMQEKRLLNPDRHPVQLDISLPKELLAKSAKARSPTEQPVGKTPAQQTLSEVNPALYGEPDSRYKMPEVNMGSSIVTAMPVMENAGGAVDTVSKGETVVAVPGMVGNKHLTGVGGQSGEKPSAEELADKMKDTVIHDQAPKGATVLFGQKEKQNEAKFDDSAMKPTTGMAAGGHGGEAAGGGAGITGVGGEADATPVGGGAAAADSPAGDEEHLMQTGARGQKVRADFTQNKVGMAYEELTAADRYVTAESRDNEPISSMKQPGEKCDLCECNPCQCGKMKHSGGGGNNPYELTYPEQKRGGKPAIHTKHREITGQNAHEARDYRGHAAQVSPGHVGIGARVSDYQGNVPEGKGDFSDPEYQERLKGVGVHGATHTGGDPIEMGGPTGKGSKTTFTTLG